MNDDDDDPQLRSMRAAWRSLPDEDPPQRGLAELMAAARRQADAMAEVPAPWWKRALAACTRPPMLALASVLVLLGGVFVVTSGHKGVSTEPTPVEDQRAAPVPEPAAATPPAEPLGGAGPAAPTVLAPPPAEPVRGAGPAAPTVPAPPPPSPPPAATFAKPRPQPKPAAHASAPEKVRRSDSVEETFGAPTAAPQEKPSPPAAAAPEDQSEASPAPTTRGPVSKSASEPTPARRQLDDQLRAQCRAAAARGDCELAKKIAQRIASDDAAYYGTNVVTDAAISKCLSE